MKKKEKHWAAGLDFCCCLPDVQSDYETYGAFLTSQENMVEPLLY